MLVVHGNHAWIVRVGPADRTACATRNYINGRRGVIPMMHTIIIPWWQKVFMVRHRRRCTTLRVVITPSQSGGRGPPSMRMVRIRSRVMGGRWRTMIVRSMLVSATYMCWATTWWWMTMV